jgi:ABC-type bacteriocin/lantibiotic exporter with double-glycine peptidase domain
MRNSKSIQKNFSLQQDMSDCGVVCLQNILKYYQADISLEKLREWSGTMRQGTSLLGLYEAARKCGFEASGASAERVDNLYDVDEPCILHVTIDKQLLHYIIYYPVRSAGDKPNTFLVGDPAKGVFYMTREELDEIWESKSVLLLKPTQQLSQWQRQKQKRWRWLLETLKEDKHLMYVAVVLGIFAAVLNISTAIFSQRLIDHIIPQKDGGRLIVGLLFLALLLVMRSGFNFIRQYLLLKQGYQFNTRLNGRFYKSILYLTKSFFDNRKTGDLIARLNDTLRIQEAVSYILGEMAIQFLLLLVSVLFIFLYSWPIGIFCLMILPAIIGVVNYFQKDILDQQRAVMSAHAQNESNYVDTIRGISTVKVMNRENLFVGVARNIFNVFQGAIFKLGNIRNRFNASMEVTAALFLLIIIGWCSWEVLETHMKAGEMIAILQMAGWLVQTSVIVALTNLQVQEARVALDRMYEFTAVEPEYDATAMEKTAGNNLQFEKLSVEKVSFRFPGKKQLLKNISFEVRKGEIIALTGESGQGKSTIMQLLQKFYSPEAGSIVFNNQTLPTVNTIDYRKLIGVVPQDIMVFSGTLVDNICFETTEQEAMKVIEFCKQHGFDEYFSNFPQGYGTILGEGGVALSGGQKQLLALARCLYANPQLLLLDEPTSAMDANTEQFVIGVLQSIRQQSGIIIISHKDSLTQIADNVYTLQSGVSRLKFEKQALIQNPAHTLQ